MAGYARRVETEAGSSPRTARMRCDGGCSRCPPARTCASARTPSPRASSSTNKLWNASRLILLRVDRRARAASRRRAVEDRWILSRLERARGRGGRGGSSAYEFSRAALELYDFVYAELCDWYLELVKPRLYDGDQATAATLLHVLTETVAMAHPVIPFVTEEIYSYIPGAEGLLAARVGAGGAAALVDVEAEAALERAIAAVQAVRGWRDAAEVKGRRDGAGAALADGVRGDARPSGAAHPACVRRASDGGDRRADSGSGWRVEILGAGELDLGAASASARPSEPSSARRSTAPRASSPTRVRREGAARPSSRPSARSSTALRCGAGGAVSGTADEAERWLLGLELFGMRFGLDRMRRLMTALGHPERLRVDPRRGDQRQVVDDADDRRDPRAARPADRRLSVSALVSYCERIRIDDADLDAGAFADAIERALRAAELVDRSRPQDDW